MAKYRRKSLELEAFQWTGQPQNEWPEWARNSLAIRYEVSNLQIDVNTGGAARCNKGDWVIKGVSDEIYPCLNAVFEKIYELVE